MQINKEVDEFIAGAKTDPLRCLFTTDEWILRKTVITVMRNNNRKYKTIGDVLQAAWFPSLDRQKRYPFDVLKQHGTFNLNEVRIIQLLPRILPQPIAEAIIDCMHGVITRRFIAPCWFISLNPKWSWDTEVLFTYADTYLDRPKNIEEYYTNSWNEDTWENDGEMRYVLKYADSDQFNGYKARYPDSWEDDARACLTRCRILHLKSTFLIKNGRRTRSRKISSADKNRSTALAIHY